MTDHDLRAEALTLAAKGYWVVPVQFTRDPYGRKSSPTFPAGPWRETASGDLAVVGGMPWADANHIAIACGPSGIAVLDLDKIEMESGPPITGADLGDELERLYPAVPDPTEVAGSYYGLITPGDGLHVYFSNDLSDPVLNSVKKIAPFADVRGVGGLVYFYGDAESLPIPSALWPFPSDLKEANKRVSNSAADTPLAPPQPRKFEAPAVGTAWGLSALEKTLLALNAKWDEGETGTFNHTLNEYAFRVGQAVGGGELDYDHASASFRSALVSLGVGWMYKTVDSGLNSGFEHPRTAAMNLQVASPEQGTAELDRILSWGEFENLPEPEWLIPGWLERGALAQMWGPPASCKSFVALDLAARLSRGESWPEGVDLFTPFTVVYIVAESPNGQAARARAWGRVYGAADVRFYPHAVTVGSLRWQALCLALEEIAPDLIILDTQARVTVGVEENSATEMGKVVETLETLCASPSRPAVLLVHHSGKPGDGSRSPSARGSSAVKGAINSEINVYRGPGGMVVVKSEKSKNSDRPSEIHFRIEPNETSAVLRRVDSAAVPTDPRAELRPMCRLVLETLSGAAGLTVGDLAQRTGKPRNSLQTACEELVGRGLLGSWNVTVRGKSTVAYRVLTAEV